MREHNERMKAIRARILDFRSKKYQKLIGELSAVCAVLVAVLATFIHDKMGSGALMVQERCGAILLSDSDGAYFVIALLAFILGAAFTAVCIGIRQKQRYSRSLEEIRND